MPGSDANSLDALVLERVIESTRDAMVFIDADARIVRYNTAAFETFGYTREEAVGEPVTLLMPEPHVSDHAHYIERYERTREARAIGQIRKVMGRRKNGEVFPLELSVTEVGASHVRYAAILRDVSERSRILQTLEHKERMAGVGLLAAMFAHEVGNPLNNMYIHAQLLERKLGRLDIEDSVGPMSRVIVGELERLIELLHEFRALYRPTHTVMSPVSVVVILDEVLATLDHEPGRAALELHRAIEPGLPPVRGNAGKLKQVFLNLCKNAIEAMPDGGRLTVRARQRDGGVEVEVEDTGVGVPPQLDPFEAFHTTKPDGSGLGLPVVRQIVRDHGGDVSFVSEPGKTSFLVRFTDLRPHR